MKFKVALSLLALFATSQLLVWTQEIPTAPTDQPAATEPSPVALHQQQLARKYAEFERTLLRIAQRLEKLGGTENRDRAQMIYRALQQARRREVADNITRLPDLLKSARLTDLQKGLDDAKTIKEDMEVLLALLLADSKQEQEFLEKMLEEVKKAIRIQAIAQARNRSSGVGEEQALKAQEKATEAVNKILERMRKQEEQEKEQKARSDEKDKEKQSGDGKKSKNGDGKSKKGDGQPKKGDGEPKKGDGESKKGSEKSKSKGGKGKQKGSQGKGNPKDGQNPQDDSGQQNQNQNQPNQNQQQQEQTPGRKRIQDANEHQKRAEDNIKKADRNKAGEDQQKAREELEAAKKKLEEILRQMREEEIERMLADLRSRCEKMLRMQELVYNSTVNLYRRVQATEDQKLSREEEQEARELADREDEIVIEATNAVRLLSEEGSAVAFLEVFDQVRSDTITVSRRLGRADIGEETQLIEQDIIDTLKEMIEALKKAQQDQQQRRNQQQQNQQMQDRLKSLIDMIAELKMIRAMQVRVNKRTALWGRSYSGEQAEDPDIARELRDLARRENRIFQVTSDIAKGKNR